MSAHEQYFQYLDGLPGGQDWRKALVEYKVNDREIAFKLNGLLRGCVPSDELADFFNRLREGIRAQNLAPFTMYRMTSVREFSAPLVPFRLTDTFPYLAFMSTSASPLNLHTFVQNHAAPLLLEIECPELTAMALMEGGGFGMEDEYLLGAGTRFRLLDVEHVTKEEDFQVVQWGAPHKEMYKARLQVAANPKYAEDKETFKFGPTAEPPE